MNFLTGIKERIESLHGTMKGQMALSGNAIGLGVFIVTLVMMAVVVQGIGDSQTANSYAANISNDGLAAFDAASGLVEPLALVMVGAVIVGVLYAAFAGRGRG